MADTDPPLERRKDHQAFRQLLNRTNAQVGLLDAIDQGYQDFVTEVKTLLKRALIAMGAIGVVAVMSLSMATWQLHKLSAITDENRNQNVAQCQDIEALKTAIRTTLGAFVPKDSRSQARFAAKRCPHEP